MGIYRLPRGIPSLVHASTRCATPRAVRWTAWLRDGTARIAACSTRSTGIAGPRYQRDDVAPLRPRPGAHRARRAHDAAASRPSWRDACASTRSPWRSRRSPIRRSRRMARSSSRRLPASTERATPHAGWSARSCRVCARCIPACGCASSAPIRAARCAGPRGGDVEVTGWVPSCGAELARARGRGGAAAHRRRAAHEGARGDGGGESGRHHGARSRRAARRMTATRFRSSSPNRPRRSRRRRRRCCATQRAGAHWAPVHARSSRRSMASRRTARARKRLRRAPGASTHVERAHDGVDADPDVSRDLGAPRPALPQVHSHAAASSSVSSTGCACRDYHW